MNTLNPLDWFLLAILAYSSIRAFFRGLLQELFSLGGLVLGILLASWNYHFVAPLFSRFVSSPTAAGIAAFLLILVVAMVASALLGKLLHHTADAIGLGFFDRLSGAAFGLARGFLLGVAILMAAAAFLPKSSWISNSYLAPYFLAGAHAVSFVVPHELQQLILDGAMQLKHNAPDWIKLRN
jgi:membrane protein required for colicin V production